MIHLLSFYPSSWYICDFFLFHIEIEGKGEWIIGAGGKVYVAPPSQIIGGPGPLAPLAPSFYAYVIAPDEMHQPVSDNKIDRKDPK